MFLIDRRPSDNLGYISGPVHFHGGFGGLSSPVRLFGWRWVRLEPVALLHDRPL